MVALSVVLLQAIDWMEEGVLLENKENSPIRMKEEEGRICYQEEKKK